MTALRAVLLQGTKKNWKTLAFEIIIIIFVGDRGAFKTIQATL
jgi:hypothetical protein